MKSTESISEHRKRSTPLEKAQLGLYFITGIIVACTILTLLEGSEFRYGDKLSWQKGRPGQEFQIYITTKPSLRINFTRVAEVIPGKCQTKWGEFPNYTATENSTFFEASLTGVNFRRAEKIVNLLDICEAD